MTTHRFLPTVYHNVIGSLSPALHIASGDIVVTQTIDATGYDSEGVHRAPSPNPMNGPIFVEGAEPGDALRLDILSMTPTRDTGFTRSVVTANVVDPETVRELPPRDIVIWQLDRKSLTVRPSKPIHGLENLILPLAPMIGCFGVAPMLGQAITTSTSKEYGGNMDYRLFGPGTRAWLPVAVPGALFFLGDCHAAQGDGEILGTGIETTFEVELRLTVEKNVKMVWPRGETDDDIFTIGNARPLEQALQHATTEMLQWLATDYSLDKAAASLLLGQVVRYDVGNVFNPAFTMACRVPKKFLVR